MTFTIETIDTEQRTIIDAYLAEHGYADLEAWGEDSDYIYHDEMDEWFDGNVFFSDGSIGMVDDPIPAGAHRLSHPLGSMVDLRVQLLAALGEI
jgi:hypothetical protein